MPTGMAGRGGGRVGAGSCREQEFTQSHGTYGSDAAGQQQGGGARFCRGAVENTVIYHIVTWALELQFQAILLVESPLPESRCL
jgi:hypothetical protein